MGAKGSGRTKESYLYQKLAGGNPKYATPAKKLFTELVGRQMGDTKWELHKKWPSGFKQFCGHIADIKYGTIAALAGGGDFECVEVNQDDEPTSRPPLVRRLHAGKYPPKPPFDVDPNEQLLQKEREASLSKLPGNLGAFDGLTMEQIFEKAKAQAKAEMQTEQELKSLRDSVAELKSLIVNGGGQGTGSRMADFKEMIALFKEMIPPPVPNSNALVPTSLAQQFQETFAVLEIAKEKLNGLNGSPIMDAVKGDGKDMTAMLLASLMDLSKTAIPYMFKDPAAQIPAPLASAAQGAAATVTQLQAPTQEAVQKMLAELGARLAQDQTLQLLTPPQGHIQNTANWLKSRWAGPAATSEWINLRSALTNFPLAEILKFLNENLPALVDSEPKKAWCASLVDLCKVP